MRVVFLADGPHQVSAPRVPAYIFLQRLGHEMETAFKGGLLRATGRKVPQLDDDGKVVKKSGKPVMVDHYEPDLEAITDHLCALLRSAEPERDWMPESVAEQMDMSRLGEYFELLWEIGEGGADPKASSEPTPPREPQD